MQSGDSWLYIVLLGTVVIVYAILIPSKKLSGGASEDTMKEVKVTLEQYMTEIEIENDEIIKLVAQLKQEHVAKQLSLQEQVNELRQRIIEIERQPMVSVVESPQDMEEITVLTELNSITETPLEEDSSLRSLSVRERYPELFGLYEQGKSIGMIAKAMDMQSGEVQLILQLATREESLL